jgi:hypothetical protein
MLRTWSREEFNQALRLHAAGWSAAEIAQAIGRTESSVRLKFIGAGYSSKILKPQVDQDLAPAPKPEERLEPELSSPPDISVERSYAEQLLETRELQVQNRKMRQQALEEAQRERLLRIFEESVRDCRLDLSFTPPAPPPRTSDPHAAVLLLGDIHVGKVCDPAETEGRAYYNPAHTVARLHLLEREAVRLIASGPPVDELYVLLCGDIIEGALDHGAEREETLLISKQFSLAVALLSQFIARMAALVPKVKVSGVCGNHGRWPNQRRMPTTGRESNFDGLVYASLQLLLGAAGAASVTFDFRESSRQLIKVKDTLVQLSHGDELRGGDYYVAGIKREVYNSVLRYSQGGRIPDLWITGDKHVSLQLPVGNGQFLVNGSFVGEDTYGQRFSPTIASQTLFWVCPQRGKTLQSDIRLDRAIPTSSLPYQLPPPLEALVASYNRHNTNEN